MPLQYVQVPKVMDEPEGNPGQMRAMAKECNAAGVKVDDSVHDASYAVRDMVFNCPAATRLRNSVLQESATQAALAKSLKRFAIDLDKAAEILETQLKMYHAQVEAEKRANAHNDRVDIERGKKSMPSSTPSLNLNTGSVFPNGR